MVSIIIPIYNCEKYLKQCLESVKNQKYSNIEVILVDDGSTDSSSVICKKIVNSDNRFRYIKQNNHGVSNARNRGIKLAQGQYLCFVDSDDILDPYYIKSTIRYIQPDCLVGVDVNYFSTENQIINVKNISNIKIIEFQNKYELLNTKSLGYVHNKMYLISKIKDNNIYFDENIYMCEDLLFNLKYLNICSKSIFVDEKLYNYRNHASLSKKLDDVRWFSIFESLIMCSDYIYKFSLDIKKMFIRFCGDTFLEAKIRRKKINNNISIVEEKQLKKIIKPYFNIKYLNIKYYIKSIIYIFFPKYIIKRKEKW